MSQSNTNREKQENIKFISDFLLRLSEIAGNARLSYDNGIYYLNVETDNGNYIVHAWFDKIDANLEEKFLQIDGVIESGLFIGYDIIVIK